MRNALLLLFLLQACFLSAQKKHHLDIYFEANSFEISLKSQQQLDSIFEELIATPMEELTLESYPQTKNRDERTREVVDRMEFYGKKVGKVVYFHKKEHLYFDYQGIVNWNFLRLVYSYPTKQVAKVAKKLRKVEEPEYLSEAETKTIYAGNENTLFLKRGCIVHIPANAFVDKNGKIIKDDVVIRTREILDGKDAILAGVTTNVAGGFLESRGMLEILAETSKGVGIGSRSKPRY